MSLDWGSPLWLVCVSVSVCVTLSVCERVSPTPAVLDGPGINCPDPEPLLNGEAKMIPDGRSQIVEYRCHEPYTLSNGTPTVRYSCSQDGTWRDHQHTETPPQCIPVCGRPVVRLFSQQRIFRGEKAPAGSMPWQVLIISPGRGGAFVIHDQWLLTAAHNLVQSQQIEHKEFIKMFVGGKSVTEMLKLSPLEVQAVRVYPLYNNPDKSNYDHDIALLKLKHKITFNSKVMPLCLPSADDEYIAGRLGIVSGFGLTENKTLLSDLQYVKLPLVEQKTCEDFVRRARLDLPKEPISNITENMFCAGFEWGGKDSCTGDSGGAFAFERDGRYWAAGIVSWGVDCGKPGYYGVYTHISKYIDWIHRIIDNQFTDCEDPKPLLNGGVRFPSITKKEYLSVIEYHCNEPYYAFQGTGRVRYTCAADGVWRDSSDSDIIPPCLPVCANPQSVQTGNVPWHVSLSVDGAEWSGSVIGNRWILTAASNLRPIGSTSDPQEVKVLVRGFTHETTALHIHPSHRQSNGQIHLNHNIALVKLKTPITFNASVMPLCLPPETSDTGQQGLKSGFQSTSSDQRGVWLPLVDHVRCSSSSSSSQELLSAQTLCSELPEGEISVDPGAGLGVVLGGRFVVAGVLIQTVTRQEGPSYGLYTWVSQYQHWINGTIQKHYCDHPELPDVVELVDQNIQHGQHSEIQLKCVSKYYSLLGEETYSCAADGVWRSRTGRSTWPKCVPVCGITDIPPYSSARILGGRVARLGALPWQLLLKEPHRAGASLLSDRWAVTAASVVDGHKDHNFTLYGGIVDGQDKKQVIMVSEKVVIHPGYQKGVSEHERSSYDNDIALIKFSSRVKLSSSLLPVCLPEKPTGGATALEGRLGTVSGFGTWERGLKSRKLRHGVIQEYSQEQCQDTPIHHGPPQQPMAFTANMFCAGLDGTDSCQGDSGGPLVQPVVGMERPGELYRLKGIVSWGPVCGSKTYYTKVQNYLAWITETMERD